MKFFGKLKTSGIIFLFLFFALVLTVVAFFRLTPLYEGYNTIPLRTTKPPTKTPNKTLPEGTNQNCTNFCKKYTGQEQSSCIINCIEKCNIFSGFDETSINDQTSEEFIKFTNCMFGIVL